MSANARVPRQCVRCKAAWEASWNFCGECGCSKPDTEPKRGGTVSYEGEIQTLKAKTAGLRLLQEKAGKEKMSNPIGEALARHAGKLAPIKKGKRAETTGRRSASPDPLAAAPLARTDGRWQGAHHHSLDDDSLSISASGGDGDCSGGSRDSIGAMASASAEGSPTSAPPAEIAEGAVVVASTCGAAASGSEGEREGTAERRRRQSKQSQPQSLKKIVNEPYPVHPTTRMNESLLEQLSASNARMGVLCLTADPAKPADDSRHRARELAEADQRRLQERLLETKRAPTAETSTGARLTKCEGAAALGRSIETSFELEEELVSPVPKLNLGLDGNPVKPAMSAASIALTKKLAKRKGGGTKGRNKGKKTSPAKATRSGCSGKPTPLPSAIDYSKTDMSYLDRDQVGSVGDMYAEFVAREKMFRGLQAVSNERLDTEVSMHSPGKAAGGGSVEIDGSHGQMEPSVTQAASWFWGSKGGDDDEDVDEEEAGDSDEEDEEEGDSEYDSEGAEEEEEEEEGGGAEGDANAATATGGTAAEQQTDPKAAKSRRRRQRKARERAEAKRTQREAEKGIGIFWAADTAALFKEGGKGGEEDDEEESGSEFDSDDSEFAELVDGQGQGQGQDTTGLRVGFDSSNSSLSGDHSVTSLQQHQQPHSKSMMSSVSGGTGADGGEGPSAGSSSGAIVVHAGQGQPLSLLSGAGQSANYNDHMPAALRGGGGAAKMPSALVSRYFQRCVRSLRTALDQIGEVDYIRDPLQARGIVRDVTERVGIATDCMEFCRQQVAAAEHEYTTVQSDIEAKRRDSAVRVAGAYEKITRFHAKYARKYLAAQEDFEEQRRATESWSTPHTYQVNSNAKMQRIQDYAEKKIAEFGEQLILLQNNEAILLKNLREAEHTLLESVNHWRPQFIEWRGRLMDRLLILQAYRIEVASRKLTAFFRRCREISAQRFAGYAAAYDGMGMDEDYSYKQII